MSYSSGPEKATPNFIQNFPYAEAREIQKEALRALEESWHKADIFVVSAPTAFGKTATSRAIINTIRETSVITPTNMLVDQFLAEFPDTPTLSRLDSYKCEEWKRPCSSTRARLKKFCKGCHCSRDLSRTKYKRGSGVYNYHTYLAHKAYRKVLIVDEAHNLIPTIQDRFSITMWQHDFKYPYAATKEYEILKWAKSLPEKKKKGKKMELLLDALTSKKPEYTMQCTRKEFNGKGTKRGEPEERNCIVLTPVDITNVPPIFWPGLGREGGDVEKLILLSATISRKDIEKLGLNKKRVVYINCESPIPAAQRPLIQVPVSAVSIRTMDTAINNIADYINNIILPNHPNEKGIIHATYGMASKLSEILVSPRYLFHDRFNKRDVYRIFRELPVSSGAVLVACGMYEGVDLPEDAGRFQVVAKVPWPNLGNSAVRVQSERDPEWYIWEALKITMQACGRICRTPTDYGATIIIDSTFQRLLREGIENKLIPQWYLDGLDAGDKLI
jgi:Rad3-related DNA helicase